MDIKDFVKRHPLLIFFVLAFALSLISLLFVVGPSVILGTTEPAEELLLFMILAMLVGPSVAGILLTGLVYGMTGFRELLSRLIRWRVGARWYAVALLTSPILATATLFALSLTSPVFLPGIVTTDDKASLLLFGIVGGLMVGFLEELGWTGFAVPRLRLRYGVLATGLIMGVLWGAWHLLIPGYLTIFPAFFWSVVILPAYRVLMVWVYDRTGSLLVAMLMHASLSASVPLILMPLAISGVPLLTWYLVLAAALWGVVVATGKQLVRAPRDIEKI
ncbi:type II CAAX endopeptidase family protein [Candidatus Borrarchaeum sp.]|uniref:type II CAAX endopeptidase family protein n=1 Tax=Candidatus Borrarchaeum sp. TaxID=2846742 RepID=UPI00257B431A|nr:type II CAAX endopeptidase family protein [Candidatus Borrarchaeum sp.]